MTKYYRVIKDNPYWEVGAIITNENDEDGDYHAIQDIWDKKSCKRKDGGSLTLYEYMDVVENSPEFFQRVYKSEGQKMAFKTAEQLKKTFDKMTS